MACRRCGVIRIVLVATLLGGGAGFAVLAYGGTREWSMAATFLAALLPVLWTVGRNRRDDSVRR